MRALLRVLVLCMLSAAARAAASDFWDEVRSPGTKAHREQLDEAEAALQQNRPERALQHADAAVARRPELAAGHAMRGRALCALGRHTQAIAAFEQALARAEDALDSEPLALAAAQSALHTARPELAIRLMTRMLSHTRNARLRPRALLMLADALQLSGPAELRRAIATYREALVDSALADQALLGLALAFHRAGEHEEAYALARRAGAKPNPAYLPAHEHAARNALWLQAIADRTAAERAWTLAAEGEHPYRDHARAALAALRESSK